MKFYRCSYQEAMEDIKTYAEKGRRVVIKKFCNNGLLDELLCVMSLHREFDRVYSRIIFDLKRFANQIVN